MVGNLIAGGIEKRFPILIVWSGTWEPLVGPLPYAIYAVEISQNASEKRFPIPGYGRELENLLLERCRTPFMHWKSAKMRLRRGSRFRGMVGNLFYKSGDLGIFVPKPGQERERLPRSEQ